MTPLEINSMKQRARTLKLHGLIAHWEELSDAMTLWINSLLDWEEAERNQRSLERRLRQARLGRFKSLADFDWTWPKQIDRTAISNLMTLDFLQAAGNAILVGTNGVGKSTIAKNIAHQAVLQGHNVLFTTAAQMLNELAAMDSDSALRRRLKTYTQPRLLVIDEVGYLSYGNRHADLLFEIINQRYEQKSTLVTTNRPFSEWGEVFPNAACVVSLIDRLVHHAEISLIEGDSYRMKEARERSGKQSKTKVNSSPRGVTAKTTTDNRTTTDKPE